MSAFFAPKIQGGTQRDENLQGNNHREIKDDRRSGSSRPLAKFELEIAQEKTKILEFGRFAAQNREKRGEGKLDTFDFLGFTFYCCTDREARFFRVKVKTSAKKLKAKLRSVKEWIKGHRNLPASKLIKELNRGLIGYYSYYGVTDNLPNVCQFVTEVTKLLFKWLNRRSQLKSYSWEKLNNGLLKACPLAIPKVKANLLA